jgi:hypothetical protein
VRFSERNNITSDSTKIGLVSETATQRIWRYGSLGLTLHSVLHITFSSCLPNAAVVFPRCKCANLFDRVQMPVFGRRSNRARTNVDGGSLKCYEFGWTSYHELHELHELPWATWATRATLSYMSYTSYHELHELHELPWATWATRATMSYTSYHLQHELHELHELPWATWATRATTSYMSYMEKAYFWHPSMQIRNIHRLKWFL